MSKLTVVGCSPAFPNPGGAHSGYLVEQADGGPSLLLDCGPGVLARLRQRDGWPTVDAIVLSHFHLDHCGDLVPWVWGRQYLVRHGAEPRRPTLLVPGGGRAFLERFAGVFGDEGTFEGTFAIEEYPTGEPFTVAGHTLVAFPVDHYGATANALRVTAPDGAILAYSGDTSPCAGLLEAAAGATLLVCEATLPTGSADGPVRGHLGLDEAEEAFARSGAGRLLVTHRPVELDPPERHLLARDGLELTL